jgi:hypothetical protein
VSGLYAIFPIRLFLVCKQVFTLIQNDRVSGAVVFYRSAWLWTRISPPFSSQKYLSRSEKTRKLQVAINFLYRSQCKQQTCVYDPRASSCHLHRVKCLYLYDQDLVGIKIAIHAWHTHNAPSPVHLTIRIAQVQYARYYLEEWYYPWDMENSDDESRADGEKNIPMEVSHRPGTHLILFHSVPSLQLILVFVMVMQWLQTSTRPCPRFSLSHDKPSPYELTRDPFGHHHKSYTY